jgi:hypothetical protein
VTSNTERSRVRRIIGDAKRGVGPAALANVAPQLAALDPEVATADDVNKVVGRPHPWVRPRACDECDAETWATVDIEPEPFVCATLCAGCLRAALALIDD